METTEGGVETQTFYLIVSGGKTKKVGFDILTRGAGVGAGVLVSSPDTWNVAGEQCYRRPRTVWTYPGGAQQQVYSIHLNFWFILRRKLDLPKEEMASS